MNKIVFELCAEDRARLDDIIAGLAALVPSGTMSDAGEALAEQHPADAPTTHLEPVETPARTPSPEIASVEPAPEVKPVSLAELQKAVTMVCAKSAAQKQAAKKIINRYAASVSEVPEDKRTEVMEAIAKL